MAPTDRHLDGLVTYGDIAKRAKMTYSWAYREINRKGAPDPITKIGSQLVWDWEQVNRYLEERRQMPQSRRREKE